MVLSGGIEDEVMLKEDMRGNTKCATEYTCATCISKRNDMMIKGVTKK